MATRPVSVIGNGYVLRIKERQMYPFINDTGIVTVERNPFLSKWGGDP